jgi:glycine cleavage system H protein
VNEVSAEFIEVTVDKFIFRIRRDCWYSNEGVWLYRDGDRVRVGLTDFVQQSSGDMAFVTVVPAGSSLSAGDELCTVETVKVAVSVRSPISGTVRDVNTDLDASPELVNEDPYGAGWLASIEASDWDGEVSALLDAEGYAQVMRGQAEEEMVKR